ncbi:hypothetical protein AB0J83_34505 [Actinoplanes sp. NPDC049596]|uniref:hypothetical protein n=1 Tax=unclassified Actinoplanes TaxID=2626549 RepID=UPI00343C4F2F
MGLLTDYFRAPSVTTVQEQLNQRDGGPVLVADPSATLYDGVEAKWIDPSVVLGQLIAFIRAEPWHPGMVTERLIWPETDDPAHQGPWTTILDNHTRDTLAAVTPDRVPALAAQWATIEELKPGATPHYLADLITELTALATRAQQAGESLFCWMSL